MKNRSFVKVVLCAGATLAALSVAPIGQAGVLTSSGLLGQSVTIFDPSGGSANTAAGAFTGATFNGGSIPDFWCVDLSHHVPFPPWSIGNYTSAAFMSSPLAFNATQVSNLETLFNLHIGTATSSAQSAAAFQLAIWDVLFDDATHSLSDAGGVNKFSVNTASISAATVSLAQGWISDAINPLGQSTYALVQLTNSNLPPNQSFVYSGTPGTREGDVPEPNGLALLGAGLFAMMFVTRRRKCEGRSA